MRVSINEEVLNKFKGNIESALGVVGDLVVTDTQQRLRDNGSVKTGNLLSSIRRVVEGNRVMIGTNVLYAPRVEFGFVGRDRIGRYFNQPPKSFLRVTLEQNRDKYINLLKELI